MTEQLSFMPNGNIAPCPYRMDCINHPYGCQGESYWCKRHDKDYPKPYISHENIAGTITPHPYSSALRAGASANYILINDERRPTERELLRIQGFPESFKIVLSYGKIKKQTGNSVAVPMIKAVAEEMVKSLKAHVNKEAN